MFLRVGEVVMERKGGMVGVVVSWDPEMRAPQEWIDRMYANSEVSDPLTGDNDFCSSGVLFAPGVFLSKQKLTLYLFLSLYMFTHAGHQSREYTSL